MSDAPDKDLGPAPEGVPRGCLLGGLALLLLCGLILAGGGLLFFRQMRASAEMERAIAREAAARRLAMIQARELERQAQQERAAKESAFRRELAAAIAEPRFPAPIIDAPGGDMIAVSWVVPEASGLVMMLGQLRIEVAELVAPGRFWFQIPIKSRSGAPPVIKTSLKPEDDFFEIKPKQGGLSGRLLGLKFEIFDASLTIDGRTIPIADTPPTIVVLDAAGQVLSVTPLISEKRPR